MTAMKKTGLFLFLLALLTFVVILSLSRHQLTELTLQAHVGNSYHREMIRQQAASEGLLGKDVGHNVRFVAALKPILQQAQATLDQKAGIDPAEGIWNAVNLPEGVKEWEYRMSNGNIDSYLFSLTKYSAGGLLPANKSLFLIWSILLGALGGLLYFLPDLQLIPGIKNNGIYHNSATKGIDYRSRWIFLAMAFVATAIVGFLQSFLPALLTILAGLLMIYLIHSNNKKKQIEAVHSRNASAPKGLGWIGLVTGILLIGFYVLLYFFPYYITNWTLMLDPISKSLSGNAASQWFLYGVLYTVVMLVMGVRMFIKYRHNRYQLVRTSSVLFFQTAFAFLIPEFLVRLNQPYMDLKNAWPLNYSFFYDYNIDSLVGGGSKFAIAGWATSVGTIMFVWGIVLALVVVPLFTYLFGKRWYCSWVCGCGGLAETLGDPYRQLSDKSLRAWQVERYLIHGVLVLAVVMTGLVLYTYWTGSSRVLLFDSYQLRSWYGFFVGAMFAGIVGTGFYPLMGNRVWCRFGCPLAALMGIVQRFKSRFRITTNGGQCISCGNCSTYCEMGIDVRSYAQRGQNVVRASCVGCGICAAVCPRGVLRLENSSEDVSTRTAELKAVRISKEGVGLVQA